MRQVAATTCGILGADYHVDPGTASISLHSFDPTTIREKGRQRKEKEI
jgi:hypothetical protein